MRGYMWDVVGYVYRAAVWCPDCVMLAVKHAGTEPGLDELADVLGVDRYREETYDSNEFPKVIFRDQAEDDRCVVCSVPLREVEVG